MVEAKEIKGNEDAVISGQTAVTARVELPEEKDLEKSTNVKTGDENRIFTYISMLMMSGTVILASIIRVSKADEN